MLGDHIRARRGGRWTHGIDCGDETILHASDGAEAGAARILRTYRPRFVAGAEAVEVVAHREPVFAASSVVARAFTPIRDPALAAMFRDSEAFARWCKTGRLPDVPWNEASGAPADRVAPDAVARETPATSPQAPRRKRPARAKPKPRPSRPARKAPSRGAPKRGPKRTPKRGPKRAAARKGARPAAATRGRKGRR